MARSSSVATTDLLSKLKERGYEIASRSIENWIALGFINKPIRQSLGRGLGTTSKYSPEIVEQCIAVSKVMRRGRPWQYSALILFVQGYTFPNEEVVRQAYVYLFNQTNSSIKIEDNEDELDAAAKMAIQVQEMGKYKPFLRSIQKNFSNSPPIIDLATTKPIGSKELVQSMLTNAVLPMLGQPLFPDIVREIIYGVGVSLEELSDKEKEAYLANICDISQYMNPKEAIQIIEEVSLPSLYLFTKLIRDIFETINLQIPSNPDLLIAQQGLVLYYSLSKFMSSREIKDSEELRKYFIGGSNLALEQ